MTDDPKKPTTSKGRTRKEAGEVTCTIEIKNLGAVCSACGTRIPMDPAQLSRAMAKASGQTLPHDLAIPADLAEQHRPPDCPKCGKPWAVVS